MPALYRLLAGLILCAVAPAQASTYCVHDSAELAAALVAIDGGGDSQLRLAAGSYALSGPVSASMNSLTFTGGWNAACTQRTQNPAGTTVDGQNAGHVLLYAVTLSVEGLHFDRVPIMNFSANTLTVRRNLFTGDVATDNILVDGTSGTRNIENNLFVRRNFAIQDYDGTDSVAKTWRVVNNTFVGSAIGPVSSQPKSGYGLYFNEPGQGTTTQIIVANNVMWGNEAGGMRINRYPSVFAVDNQWQSLTNVDNVALANGSTGNATANPQLDANWQPVTPGSPTINSGTTAVPGGIGASDVAGHPRTIGSAPDRGAYESAADDAAVLTVTNTADAGGGSLRAALTASAAAGNAQRIEFAIAGACPRVINVPSALPAIVDTLTIDGYTQPGASANTLDVGSDAHLCVVLHGSGASEGLVASGANSRLTVRGLAFENFGYAALEASSGSDHVIEGNQFGGPLAGGTYALASNVRNIRLSGDANGASVGGPDPAQRNVIAGASNCGVGLIGTSGVHQLIGNYVGLAPDGATPAGNGVGVIVQNYLNTLQGNFIAANANEGVRIETTAGQGTVLVDNVIGLAAAGQGVGAGNGGAGVRITGAATNNHIGETLSHTPGPNRIAGNGINGFGGPAPAGEGGVSIESGAQNRITGNRIYANWGLSIDLGHDGATPNDATDADTGANQLQNFPLLTAVRHVGGMRLLTGSVYAAASLKIEVYGAAACDYAGRASAGVPLNTTARAILAPLGGGTANFTIEAPRDGASGVDPSCRLGATATDPDGNTSELSACFVDDTIFAWSMEGPGYACGP